jgi:hypothetical protein
MTAIHSLPLRGRAGVGATIATASANEAPTPPLPREGREEIRP